MCTSDNPQYDFPVGKSTIIIRSEDLAKISFYQNQMFYDNVEKKGLLQVTILPPQDLHIPFLALKVKLKSGFKSVAPLCQRCAETEMFKVCTHTRLERALTSTWTASEVAFSVCS